MQRLGNGRSRVRGIKEFGLQVGFLLLRVRLLLRVLLLLRWLLLLLLLLLRLLAGGSRDHGRVILLPTLPRDVAPQQ